MATYGVTLTSNFVRFGQLAWRKENSEWTRTPWRFLQPGGLNSVAKIPQFWYRIKFWFLHGYAMPMLFFFAAKLNAFQITYLLMSLRLKFLLIVFGSSSKWTHSFIYFNGTLLFSRIDVPVQSDAALFNVPVAMGSNLRSEFCSSHCILCDFSKPFRQTMW